MKNKNQAGMAESDLMAKAKKDALRLLSFRPRSVQELRRRLLEKKHEPVMVDRLLEDFSKKGLLDDEKFAKLYALSSIQSRPVGKNRIQHDLKIKGVSPAIVSRALGAISDFDEKQVALDMAIRRHQRMSRLPANVSKVRLYGFLKRRGFSSEAVYYALSKLQATAGDSEPLP